MRSALRACALFACVVLSFLGGLSFSPAATPDVEGSPAKLVRAALEAELAGSPQDRERLLGEALVIDPDFAPARWQSGFVRIGSEWIKLDDVPKRVAGDPQLVAYRKKRDALIDTADNHRELARWCHKNRLPDEERVHWIKVLEFNQQDAEAIAGLGLELYEGRLMTRGQIEEAKATIADRLKAMRKWQQQLLKWRKAIEGGDSSARDAARQQVRSCNEAAAVAVLEALFAAEGENARAVERNQLLIEVLSQIPEREATEALVRRAILSDSRVVRFAAARSLKQRSPSAFVPQLIGLLPANENVETRHRIYLWPGASPNGGMELSTVIREHELIVRDVDTARVRSFFVWDQDVRADEMPLKLRLRNRWSFYVQSVVAFERQLETLRRDRKELRDRVQAALFESTDFGPASSAEEWLKQLEDYYETYSRANIPSQIQPEWAHYECYQTRYTTSCFPKGTLIQTFGGATVIEALKPGDRVLSQNQATGELAFKTVQAVTLRPAAPLVEIGVGSETIRATRGHPFWVNGEGWRMAKQLSVGAKLHAIGGGATIHRIGEGREREAYNLVVSDFGTYFVGQSRVLVHDNMPLAETATLVPGLAAQREVP